MSISPGLLILKKTTKAYSLYACSLGFIMQSPAVLGLCVIAVLACGVVDHVGHHF